MACRVAFLLRWLCARALLLDQTDMPLNIPGLLASFQLVWNPRVVLPHVIVTGQTNVLAVSR